MALYDVLLAGGVLVLMVGLGTIVHELSHALVLRRLDVPHDLRWLPDRGTAGLVTGYGRLAAVVPQHVPSGVSPWGLRTAALAPLALAIPMPLVLLGVLPDPFAAGNVPLSAAAVGWFACAIPSPTDFSLVWYAESVVGADDPSALGEAA